MARNQRTYIKGTFTRRRTETDYMGVLLDTVSLADWHGVVGKALTMAKDGDPAARAWLAQYLIGKPAGKAPEPLTVVVRQLSGRDPVVEKLAKPHIDRVEYPALHADDDTKDAVRARVAAELNGLARITPDANMAEPPEENGSLTGNQLTK